MTSEPDEGMSDDPGDDPARAAARQLCRRVRALRAARGWSLDGLAKASGVSRSMLSQIERDEANPTLAVLFRIAQAFRMPLGELIESESASSTIDLIRADDRAHHYRSDSECQIRTLSPLHLEKDVEFYEIRLGISGALRSAPHFEGTRELLTVQKGKVRVTSAEDRAELNHGDSAHYRADVPHAIENTGRGEAILYLVVNYTAGR